MTYRATPAEGAAWVTGASSGIGRGAALELARRGWRVYATARRSHELETLAAEAAALKGAVIAAPGDVTDRAEMAALAATIESRQPLALALVNAGGYFPDADGDLGGDGFVQTFALNVQGVANCVNPAFNAMRARRRGQIAVVASIAGYLGLPGQGAYGPSKAAVISLVEGLKFAGDRVGVTVQVVNPGYVRTPLSARNAFSMPLLMECDEGCRRLVDGLERGGFEIRFPTRMALLARLVSLLPYAIYFPVGRAIARRQ
jgi:NAD(P)-dependent dehydrogenase (short-subunit alcohol dehydrogenase family)